MLFFASPIGDSPEARRYNRIVRRVGIADAALGLVLMVVVLATGWTNSLRDLSFHVSSSPVLALFFYILVLSIAGKLLGLGLDYYLFRLEHEYHLSNQKLRAWTWDQVKSYLVGLTMSVILAELLYVIIRSAPQGWWIVGWFTFLALFVFMANVAPVLLFPIFYRFKPLENDSLRERLTRMSEKAGTRVRGVYEWALSEKTNKANAALTGLGNTRRIILADTLLERYSDDEIEAVLAHELGHHVHKHIFKSILVQAVISFVGFWAMKSVLRYSVNDWKWFPHQYDFANLPLVVLVTTGLSLLLLPLMNAYSRFNERQADRYAWENITSIKPFLSAMNKLADQNLAERQPARWVEWLFYSHPAVGKRIAAAEAWAAKRTKK